jgi:polar amino acid transport system substrate-binding protein
MGYRIGRICAVLSLLALVGFSYQIALAQATSAQQSAVAAAKARGKLVVGVRYDFPPFGFVDEQRQVVGLEIDMTRELAANLLGNRDALELVEVSGPNRIPFLVTAKVDIVIAALSVTPERAKTVSFSEPYYIGGYTVMTTKDNAEIKDMSSLSGKRVGITRGSTAEAIVAKLEPQPAQIVKLEHISELLSVIQAQRVDAIVQDRALLQPFVSNNPGFKLVGGLYNEEPWAVGIRKDDKETVDWVNSQIGKMKQSGRLDEWLAKWGLR